MYMNIIEKNYTTEYFDMKNLDIDKGFSWSFERDGHRAKWSLHPFEYFPISKSDFKKFMEILTYEAAEMFHDYFSYMIEKINYHVENATTGEFKAGWQKDLRRWIALDEVVCKYFGFDMKMEKIENKTKPATVFSNATNSKGTTTKRRKGRIFEHEGITFAAYKGEKRSDPVYIILASSGYCVHKYDGGISDCYTRFATDVRPDWMEKIKNIVSTAGYMDICKKYTEAIENIGEPVPEYITNEINRLQAEISEKATPEKETDTPEKAPADDSVEKVENKEITEAEASKKMSIDINYIIEAYNFYYDKISHPKSDYFTRQDIRAAADRFDEYAKNKPELLKQFNQERQDFISSDTEAAAFMCALDATADWTEYRSKKASASNTKQETTQTTKPAQKQNPPYILYIYHAGSFTTKTDTTGTKTHKNAIDGVNVYCTIHNTKTGAKSKTKTPPEVYTRQAGATIPGTDAGIFGGTKTPEIIHTKSPPIKRRKIKNMARLHHRYINYRQ